MLKPDTKYNGTVAEGGALYETAKGSIGFRVPIDYEGGSTEFIIWLTEKARERARKTFIDVLGVDPEKLLFSNYFEYQLGQDIVGREISFGTKEEEYNGRRKVKVSWIGKKSESLSGGVSNAAAVFFGGKPKPTITDEDIPF